MSLLKSTFLKAPISQYFISACFLSSKAKKFQYTLDDTKLTKEQREFYEDNGFIVIKNLVPKKEIKKYDERFKAISNGLIKNPGMVVQKDISFLDQEKNENTVYKLQELYTDDELFGYCKLEPILEYVSGFCGPNLMAIHTMLINKPPDSGTKSSRHPLHQDLYYFPIRPGDRIVCAWTAMEAVNRANGCLVALPGTHKGKLYSHEYPDWEGGVNKMFHGIPSMASQENKAYLEMDSGDTVFFHPILIHGSGRNRTKGYRKAISCHYASSNCNYIDVMGTAQEKIAREVLDVAKKQLAIEIDDYRTIWKYRSKLVQGNQINL